MHEGVVVRHLARGVADSPADEHISLGPVDLYVPRSDRSETQATPIGTEFVRQLDFVSLSKVQSFGVFPGDEDVPAPGTKERIDVFLDHRIELFSAARAQKEPSFRDVEVRERHEGEASPAAGRGEKPTLAKAGAPAMECAPFHPQLRDPVLGRQRPRYSDRAQPPGPAV